jgi:2-polyprenyl-3-methyl-5-hydroxy-6-metoxy-1,4-benzoquinol methylase
MAPSPASDLSRPADASTLITRSEWEGRIHAIDPAALGVEPFGEILLRHLPVRPGWEAIELGAIPGRFLRFMHQAFGYRVTALDYARDWTAFDEVMRRGGSADAVKLERDILQFETDRTWDVVASFGLIEHFRDTADIVRRHTRLVRPGGYLVLSVPNFTRLQFAYHWLVDRPNLAQHNTRAMDRQRLEHWVRGEGFQLIHSGHIGRMEFWHEATSLQLWQRAIVRGARWFSRNAGARLPISSWYSPYYMLIAQRA